MFLGLDAAARMVFADFLSILQLHYLQLITFIIPY